MDSLAFGSFVHSRCSLCRIYVVCENTISTKAIIQLRNTWINNNNELKKKWPNVTVTQNFFQSQYTPVPICNFCYQMFAPRDI